MTKKPLLTFCLLAAVAVAAASIHTFAQAANAAPSTNHDWPMFGLDVARSSSLPGPTGIDAQNVASLQRQAAAIDGTSDASVIYLHGVRVSGGAHDVFFLTTEYGKTLAIDADTGKTLWAFTPPGYGSWVGSRQITNSTPVADPGRELHLCRVA